VLNKTTKVYEAGKCDGAKRKRYVTPFSEAVHIWQGAAEPLPELLQKAETHAFDLYKYIARRNMLVHGIATPQGRGEKARLSDPPLPAQDLKASFSAERNRRFAAAHEQRVAEALNTSMDWYKLLARASSIIFEYSLRKYAGLRTSD
jgi:hypothetical protein